MIRRAPRTFARIDPMSPSPRPLPKSGPSPGQIPGQTPGQIPGPSAGTGSGSGSGIGSGAAPHPASLTEGAASSTGSSSGAGSSLITSLAVHGLALATLVMAVKVPWRGSNEEPERIVTCALEPTVAPSTMRDEREPPLEIEAPGWKSEIPVLEAFEVPEDPAPAEPDAASDDVPEQQPPARAFDRYAEPTLDLTPKARPKFVRPHSLPRGAAPDPQPSRKPMGSPASTAPAAGASPLPIDGACPPPIFPKIAQLRGWSGTVHLSIDVSASGSVTGVRIDSSSGHAILDEAAKEAVRSWRFRPAIRGGFPASVTVRKPIEFSLGGA